MSRKSLGIPVDYVRHNEDVRQVWDSFHKGTPTRVPIQFSMNDRMILQDPELNVWGYTWKQYFEDPAIRWTVQLRFQHWVRANVMQDAEMGLPEKSWNGIYVHYQNCDEAAWFGCPFYFPSNDMPFIEPILRENKQLLYDMTPPDPLHGGIMSRAIEHFQFFEDKRANDTFEGIPIGRSFLFGAGTDGPLTLACNLRGASEVARDFYEDPQYVHDLLGFITDAVIKRIKVISAFNGAALPMQGWFFADDSIELISTAMYKEFVLPYHRRLLDAFSLGGPNGIHLCGRVQRYVKVLSDELNIKTFDLGFPTNMALARHDVGNDVTLIGNIAPHLLQNGSVESIREAVKKLCTSGVMQGGKFILHEGNNCAPCTPLEHFEAMYDAGKYFGSFSNAV